MTSHGFFHKKTYPCTLWQQDELKTKIFIFHGRMNIKDSSYETKIIKSFSQNGKSQPPFQT